MAAKRVQIITPQPQRWQLVCSVSTDRMWLVMLSTITQHLHSGLACPKDIVEEVFLSYMTVFLAVWKEMQCFLHRFYMVWLHRYIWWCIFLGIFFIFIFPNFDNMFHSRVKKFSRCETSKPLLFVYFATVRRTHWRCHQLALQWVSCHMAWAFTACCNMVEVSNNEVSLCRCVKPKL